MPKILLTGATGYLGWYISKSLLEQGFELIALCLNEKESYKYSDNKNVKIYYLNKTPLDEIFNENKPDIVIHTATLYGRGNETITNMIQANEIFPVEIWNLCAKYHAKAFINTDSILQKKVSYYSLTKNHLTDWLEFFCDKFICVNLKLDQFYGPNDKPTKFIAWLVQQFKNNEKSIDLTEGLQKRDFIYVDDVVEAFNCVIKNIDKLKLGQVNYFEVGTNDKHTIKEMVLMLKKEMDNTVTNLNFGALPYRKNDALDYDINTKALRDLGWQPKVFLEDGLKKVAEAEKENNG